MPAAPVIVLAALLLLLPPPAAASWRPPVHGDLPDAAAWRPPVDGPVVRGFDVGPNPFAGGHHRGVDLLADPGAPVRAACAGRVVVAGRVGASGGVVTVLCGRWRVSHMPLAAITARPGTTVAAGARLGTLAPGHAHAGLHLGVRRDGDRFGYVDPLRFLGPLSTTTPPALGRAPRSRRGPGPPHTRPAPHTGPASHTDPAPYTGPAPHTGRAVTEVADPAPLAPWPAWIGLALVLAGVGTRWRGTNRNRTRGPSPAVVTVNE